MVPKSLKKAPRIVRKATIPESDRTQNRDSAADWIDENAADNWQDWTFSEIAEETGFSRQHVANTVEKYYEPADGREESTEKPPAEEQPTPADAASVGGTESILEAYDLGFQRGYEMGRKHG